MKAVQIGFQHESPGALVDTCRWIKDGLAGKITPVESWMSRNTPNANVDIGYRPAIAAHMANIPYRQKRRLTLEEAKAVVPQV